ncbi:Na+/Picotransporter [Ancylobacter amanitiformis]|uniref:Phosphate:Na+ symporter n=1 Tax=Ancylobacter amanitiformis TaxID=217069 RepID=A0ABU0LKP5_9HYPH|nr:Na+/Picotransporter [Ancylobacter amanitiformis]MDQ0509235.1 phosphate:Na+ symporter [Ancylobacter amanitiformis]
MSTIASLLCGLGLFFIGVRMLSANLVPLVGRRARAVFARALHGTLGCAASGVVAGIVTQSSTAVSWIIVSFVRGGVLPPGPALLAPTWSNVGTALLPLIVAVNTATPAGIVIGIVGSATYFRLVRGDRMRNALDAALGGALLLFGMYLVSSAVGPLREQAMQEIWWQSAVNNPWLLALVGAGFAFAAQSSSVAAALAVASISGGLLTLSAAFPLIAGANIASGINNALMIPGETAAGRTVFALQVVQKGAGGLLLAALSVVAAVYPDPMTHLLTTDGLGSPGAQIALVFLLAQVGGALVTSWLERPCRRLLHRLMPASPAETLAEPAFLLREALGDPATALELSLREVARLTTRLPQMLDRVREDGPTHGPAPAALRLAGATLAATVKTYLASLLDSSPTRPQVAVALLLDEAATTAGALHEALAEFAQEAAQAREVPTAQRLVEALHAILGAVADHAEALGAEDPALVIALLGHRDQLMEGLRLRLSSQEDIAPAAQNALFRMTVLFERIVWQARGLVNDFTQVHRAAEAS